MMAVEERLNRHALSSFDLHLARFQRCLRAAVNEEPLLERPQTAGMTGTRLLGNSRFPYVEPLIAEKGVRTRPRQEATHAVDDFLSGPAPIDEPVFFFENRREGGFGGILFHWRGIFAECSNQKLGAGRRQPLADFQGIFFRTDFGLPLE